MTPAHASSCTSTLALPTNRSSRPARRPYEDELAPEQPKQRRAVRVAALVPPALILLGLLAHTVLEGLAIGLQVRAMTAAR